jgi:hypothetical protein
VGHAGEGLLRTAPVIRGRTKRPNAFALYRRCVLADIWPENDHEATGSVAGMQSGTSTLALMKVLQGLGFIDGYEWEYLSVDVIIDVLCARCPVIVGIPWWSNWMATDDDGNLPAPSGRMVGGHEVLLSGWNDRTGMIRLEQSWGRTFGTLRLDGSRDGQGWLDPMHLEYSLHRNGEAVVPSEVRRSAHADEVTEATRLPAREPPQAGRGVRVEDAEGREVTDPGAEAEAGEGQEVVPRIEQQENRHA